MHPMTLCNRCKGIDPDCDSCLGLGEVPAGPDADDGDPVANFTADPDAREPARAAREIVGRLAKHLTPADVLGDPEPRECHCISCGCTDSRACLDREAMQPCHWLRKDRDAGLGVCSCCEGAIPAWDRGDRSERTPCGPVPLEIFAHWLPLIPDGVTPEILVCFGGWDDGRRSIAVLSQRHASNAVVAEVLRNVADWIDRQAGAPSQAIPSRVGEGDGL